ncbi:MAG TPA: CRTAC1 family protein [Vicinamibacteria bacterium]|nr:CRTAC1 family protein [Vicinamibacteria bacterium]
MSPTKAWVLSVAVFLGAEHWGRLVDIRTESGVDFITESGDREKRTILSSLGGGVGLLDYDADGDLDLYFVRKGRNGLYRNDGQWRFRDVTEEAAVGDPGWSVGCAAGDIDNDGLVDLYVTNLGANTLYRNRGDGTFEDVSRQWAVADEGFGSSAVFFDADGDGDLDLYVANYVDPKQTFPEPGTEPTCLWLGMPVMCGPRGLAGQEDVFYRNDGARFVDASKEAGLLDSGRAYGLGVVSGDYDDDGDADLYVANDTNPNFLYRNDGSGHFEDAGLLSGVAYNDSGATEAGMGVDFGDVNADGHLDIFVTNFSHETNTLYIGSEDGLFTDATEEAGLSTPSLGKLGWGTRFVDLDLDGDEDLFIANGHVYPNVSAADVTTSYEQRDQVFLNDGGGIFLESAISADSAEGPRSSRGAALGDLDDDGDTDVVTVAIDDQPTILRNELTRDARWVGIVLVGRQAPRDGTGARLRLRARSRVQTKIAHASGSVFSSSDSRVLFGLGKEDAEELAIDWPSGVETRLLSPSANRYLVVIEGVRASEWLIPN